MKMGECCGIVATTTKALLPACQPALVHAAALHTLLRRAAAFPPPRRTTGITALFTGAARRVGAATSTRHLICARGLRHAAQEYCHRQHRGGQEEGGALVGVQKRSHVFYLIACLLACLLACLPGYFVTLGGN